MYDTRKRRNKADVCRSHGGSYGAVRGGCERLGRDEWKAEETTTALAKNIPESLAIYDDKSGKWEINIIKAGVLQADGVTGNEATEYKGTNWYYDGAKNQLVLNGASIKDVICKGGDLSILLSGENILRGEI